jgi:hypothetical protein
MADKIRCEVHMDITAIPGNTAMAAIVRQLQTVNEVQTAVMAQIADSQQQMAAILEAAGIGQTIDIQA